MGWRHHTDLGVDRTVHVWPDSERHATGDDGEPCWCSPDVEAQPNGALLVVHRDELDRLGLFS